MARYELRFRGSVDKDFDPIPRGDARRILAAIVRLADDPRPPQSQKLSASEKYRLRCGKYRVLYEIQDDLPVVCVVKVGHRREVYRA